MTFLLIIYLIVAVFVFILFYGIDGEDSIEVGACIFLAICWLPFLVVFNLFSRRPRVPWK